MAARRPHDLPAVRVDPETGWAWRGDERLDLAPKAFAVLRHLVEHPEHLLTKDDLLAVAWGDTVVSEATLTSCIRDLRRALDDSSRAPRYIETVHRRGFRFIGPVGPPRGVSRTAPADVVAVSAPPAGLVGRDSHLARLQAALGTALGGRRRLVFVTGEAGIGKTTLVETFLGRLVGTGAVRIARGQCVEQYGATEPYLPVLEALGRLGREPGGEAVVGVLKRYAPTWLVQLPALLADDDLEPVQRRAHGTTRERMLRELSEALDALSEETPLVLLLEDLHWSDSGTVDLLAMLARRPDRARLLVLGTYRPADVAAGGHPVKAVQQELAVHGACEELALEFLDEAAICQYLAHRFAAATFPAGLTRVLEANTGGNPLFLVNVIDDLVARGVLRDVDGRWTLAVPAEQVAAGVPHTLTQMIEKQLDRLAPAEQAMLAVGSVAGAEFSAALATVDGIDPADGERCCATLARRGQFLRARGIAEWPDGTVAGRYAFIHALYRDVLYARVSIGHRVGLHLRIGARLERAHGASAAHVAGELAMHFEHGRDLERAVAYRGRAADAALRQHAHREAVQHAERALELLATLPPSAELARQEVAVQTVLGAALIATTGWTAPEVARAYARARAVCAAAGIAPPMSVLSGMCGFSLMRGELDVTEEASRQLGVLADATGDPVAALVGHQNAGLAAFYRGELLAARTRLDAARAIYDPERHAPHRLNDVSVDHDAGVSCAAHTAMTLMLLGLQDQATAQMRDCLAHARAIEHPLSIAMAYNFAASFHQFRREPERVREVEAVREEYARKHDFDLFLLLGEISRGWLLAEDGALEEAAARIEQGLVVFRAIGAELGRPTFLGILADVRGRLGRHDAGLAAIAEALELGARTGLRYWDAELHRLRGTLLLGAAREGAGDEAQACFREALAIARRQEARAFELRVATSLARLWQAQGRLAEARELVAGIHGSLTEGFALPDARDATALLEALRAGTP
jgi:DNA-binding winged helix-turn-helix (wHTH) protein/predicted ATPase